MSEITDELVEVGARSDAEFDGRPWLSMGKADRDRYLARSRLALSAVAPLIAAQEREAIDAAAKAIQEGRDWPPATRYGAALVRDAIRARAESKEG